MCGYNLAANHLWPLFAAATAVRHAKSSPGRLYGVAYYGAMKLARRVSAGAGWLHLAIGCAYG